MPFHCYEDGVETFGPHQAEFASIVHAAIADVYRKYGQDFHELEAWTKSGIIRDKIVSRLKRYCDETPGLQQIRKGNATYFGFHSKYLVKAKKFSTGFRLNLPTTISATLFDHQECPIDQGELLEPTDVTTVYVGYIPTENAPLSPPVFIVCKNELGQVAWVIECEPPEPPPAIELHPASPEAGGPAPVRIKPKVTRNTGTDD